MTRRRPPELPTPRREKDRTVTREEAQLWQQVTQTVEPKERLGKRAALKSRVATQAAGGEAPERGSDAKPARTHRPVEAPAQRPAATRPEVHRVPHPVAPPRQRVPQLADFERRKARHIASGRIEIDGRLDLHGLRQGEARHRLIGFLRHAVDRGHRTVLVITGKGMAAPVDPLAHALGEPQRGVLRRLVPQWLEEPECRVHVISFTTASAKHGGDGALYVRLRRGG